MTDDDYGLWGLVVVDTMVFAAGWCVLWPAARDDKLGTAGPYALVTPAFVRHRIPGTGRPVRVG